MFFWRLMDRDLCFARFARLFMRLAGFYAMGYGCRYADSFRRFPNLIFLMLLLFVDDVLVALFPNVFSRWVCCYISSMLLSLMLHQRKFG